MAGVCASPGRRPFLPGPLSPPLSYIPQPCNGPNGRKGFIPTNQTMFNAKWCRAARHLHPNEGIRTASVMIVSHKNIGAFSGLNTKEKWLAWQRNRYTNIAVTGKAR